ncbi:MAG TPA: sigma-70 family RNA polymerase sigma factor [Puia sp.]|uniref:RNA polymerase sigma factor n=1 Tax=Puia sp. TaxID=2045100 RepID=UPI002CD71A42|nr:sigma-70 family RNA polymerase sigma factor [Puia sp.]HVU98130.1 sigma-70 family RNA polymerase sigma factor [Puia sp.]
MSLEVFKGRILPMKDKLFRFAFRLLRDIPEAEDTVQDVFVGVWAKRAEWPQWKSIEAYCMTATRNGCLDRLRRRRVRTVPESSAYPLASPDNDPHEKMTSKEMIQRIRQCMDALPEQQQWVVRLREMEGFSYNEIAEVLDITLDQVKINLFRGRNAIRKMIPERRGASRPRPS